MATSMRTETIPSYRPKLDTRSDHVCRWSAYGSRAYTGIQRKSVHTPTRPHNDKRPLIWFGGDGLKAGFTVSNVRAVLDGKPYRQSVTGDTLAFYYRKLKNISIFKACEALARVGCADDTFYRTRPFAKGKYNRSYCTAAKVSDLKGWYNGEGWFKADIHTAGMMGPIKFLGGPPSRWGIQEGSLFTLLMDRIAVTILLGGATADTYLRLEDYIPKGA